MQLPLDDGTEWEVPEELMKELSGAYQKEGLETELTKMRLWLLSNPDRRKTRRGIKRFVTNWLFRAGIPMKLKIGPTTCAMCPRISTVKASDGASYCDEHKPAQDRRVADLLAGLGSALRAA